jgi:threonine synthase
MFLIYFVLCIGNYDIRVICKKREKPESIANKILTSLQQLDIKPTYISTRSAKHHHFKSFNDVVLEGLASDNGLYVPETDIPHFKMSQWERLVPLSYNERAQRVLEKWLHPSQVQPSSLGKMLRRTYTKEKFDSEKVFPVVPLYDNYYVNELFHGPTASFKDAALQLLPHFFSHALKHTGKSKEK